MAFFPQRSDRGPMARTCASIEKAAHALMLASRRQQMTTTELSAKVAMLPQWRTTPPRRPLHLPRRSPLVPWRRPWSAAFAHWHTEISERFALPTAGHERAGLGCAPLPLRQPTRLRAPGECVRLPCAVSPCGTRAGAGAHCGISAVRSLHSTDARASVSALAGQRVYRIAPGPAPPKYEPQPAGLRLEEWHPIGSAV